MNVENVEGGRKMVKRDTVVVVGLFASIFLFPALFYCIGSISDLRIAFFITMMMWALFCLIWIGYWWGNGDLSRSKEEIEK